MIQNKKRAYSGSIFNVYKTNVVFNNGAEKEMEYVGLYEDTFDSVLIAAITTEDEVIFIEEFCTALNKSELVLPGGVVDEGESVETAAIRELGEEAKLLAQKIEIVTTVEVLPKYVYSQTHLVIATNLTPTEEFTGGDEVEELKLHKIKISDLEKKIKDGEIRDSRTINLLLFLLLKTHSH